MFIHFKPIIISLILLSASIIKPQTIVEKKIFAIQETSFDNFGVNICLNDNFLVTGANQDDNENGMDAGAVFIFKKNNLIQKQRLLSVNGNRHGGFGLSASIFENQLVIGEPGNNELGDHAGKVYIYNLKDSLWEMSAEITASDTKSWDYFGISTDSYKNNLIIGARGADNNFNIEVGAAYIFEKDSTDWIEVQKLMPNDLEEYDSFGSSVSISDSFAVVGAPQKSAVSRYSGSAYIYKNSDNTWELDTILIGSTVSEDDYYGGKTAIKDNFVFISAEGNIYSTKPGKVYIFKNIAGKWIERDILQASDGYRENSFGTSIFVKGDSLLIGACNWISNYDDPGAVYLFVREKGDKWIEKEKFVPDNSQDYLLFGSSVAMNDEKIFIGAPGDNTKGTSAGAVYYYPGDPVGVKDEIAENINSENSLNIFPNPFNNQTTLSFYLTEEGNVKLSIFNILGEKISTLVNKYYNSGTHSYSFNASSFTSGLYFILMETQREIITEKILIIK